MLGLMKGAEESEMAIGTIIFVGGLLLISVLLFSRFTQFGAVIKNNEDALEMINIAHYAKGCFSSDGFLQEYYLTNQRKSDCEIKAKICIKDLQSAGGGVESEWLDCSAIENPGHTIHAPLMTSGGEIHMGEIIAEK